MDIDRAFERRQQLLKRLEKIETLGFSNTETPHRASRFTCLNSVTWSHGARNWQGRCPYCDYYIGKKSGENYRPEPNVLNGFYTREQRMNIDAKRLDIDDE